MEGKEPEEVVEGKESEEVVEGKEPKADLSQLLATAGTNPFQCKR